MSVDFTSFSHHPPSDAPINSPSRLRRLEHKIAMLENCIAMIETLSKTTLCVDKGLTPDATYLQLASLDVKVAKKKLEKVRAEYALEIGS